MPLIPKKMVRPTMVNRGGAGLLSKVALPDGYAIKMRQVDEGRINDVRCLGEVVPVDSLVPDPNNARLHPDRNLQAIMDSYRQFGQRSPLIVRRQNMTVAKGNGSLEAVKALGWTHVAVDLQDMTDVEFAGYALADNRTAELATWNLDVVSRIDKLLFEAGQATVGFTAEEVYAMRVNLDTHLPEAEKGQDWRELWQGMPEFEMNDQRGYKHVVVNFRNEEDYAAFLQLIGQESKDVLNRSCWYPKAEMDLVAGIEYRSGEEEAAQPADADVEGGAA